MHFIFEDEGKLVGGLARMLSSGAIMNPEWDVGFVEFASAGHVITALVPLEPWKVSVTEEIAACGYPYGTEMLKRDAGQVYRFGPVIRRGTSRPSLLTIQRTNRLNSFSTFARLRE